MRKVGLMVHDTHGITEHAPATFVVGVGASAGGVEALQELFQALPANSGLGFVVIQHLSPDHRSLMALSGRGW